MPAKHVVRALLLLILGFLGFLVFRQFMIPSSFGMFGHFRGANVKEQMAHPLVHGGAASCEPCHKEQFKTVHEGSHKTVQCENCHAPLARHAQGDKKVADMPKDQTSTLCLRCHEKLIARPKTQPQVDPVEHLETMGEEFHSTVCIECHVPHAPSM